MFAYQSPALPDVAGIPGILQPTLSPFTPIPEYHAQCVTQRLASSHQ